MQNNAYFYALKCRKKSLLFSQTKSYYFSLFFDPNLPIFGFSRLAALILLYNSQPANMSYNTTQ